MFLKEIKYLINNEMLISNKYLGTLRRENHFSANLFLEDYRTYWFELDGVHFTVEVTVELNFSLRFGLKYVYILLILNRFML